MCSVDDVNISGSYRACTIGTYYFDIRLLQLLLTHLQQQQKYKQQQQQQEQQQ